jgi:ABC-type amino acid transport substrate-binding protein
MASRRSRFRRPSELIVGLDAAPPPPLQFGPPGTPEFRGLEVDLLGLIVQALRREPVYRVALWSELLDRLAAGRIDLVCSAATVTAERRRLFDFSIPYLSVSLALAARDESLIHGTPDLSGARVAVRTATVADAWAASHLSGAQLVRFELNTEAYHALARRQVDALIDDTPIAGFFVRTTPGLRLVEVIPETAAEYAIVFAQGNSGLRDAVDAALREAVQAGDLERVRRRWLGDS